MSLSKKLSRTKRNFFIVAFALVLFGSTVTLIHFLHLFRVQQVVCEMHGRNCPDYLQAELEKNVGKSLLFTRFDSVIEKILLRQPSLLVNGFRKNPSGIVTFSFQEIEPEFAIRVFDGRILLINARNLITDQVTDTNLPVIHVFLPESALWVAGERLPQDIADAMSTFFWVTDHKNIPFESVQISIANQLEVRLTNGKRAILPFIELREALQKLDFLLHHQAELEKKEPYTTLDFRFRYPLLQP